MNLKLVGCLVGVPKVNKLLFILKVFHFQNFIDTDNVKLKCNSVSP